MKILKMVALAALLALPAYAADAPLLSGSRASVAVQGGLALESEEWGGVAALSPAYSLGPTVAVIAPVRYGFENEEWGFEPKLSVVVLPGQFEVALQAGYAFSNVDQGFAGASLTVPLGGSRFALSFPARYGFKSEDTRLEAKLSFLAGGK